MKRIMSIFLILIIFFITLPSDALASAEGDLKAAIKKSKTLFDISDEYENFDYSVSKNEGIRVYNLNWRNKSETDFISVTIDNDGFILAYDKSSVEEEYEKKIPSVSEKEGIKIAKDFIAKVNPDIKDNIEYKGREFYNDVFMNRYYFTFVRTINGVKYQGNTANVQIDNKTKEVKSFNMVWDKSLVFPEAKDIITLKEAENIYKDKIKFDLLYKYDYTTDNKTPRLVYSLINQNQSVSAKDGKVLDYTADFYYPRFESTESMKAEGDAELSQEEIKEITNAKKLLTESEAEEIARKFAKIDNKYEMSYVSLYKDGETYTWFLDFSRQENAKYFGKQVVIDAQTKEVKSFSDYSEYNTSDEFKYTKEESLKLAKAYLNEVQSKKAKQVEYMDITLPEDTEDGPYYTFNFTRKVNGILFEGDGFSIGIDKRNGNIVNYNYTWYDKELKKPGKVVTKEEAYDTLLKQAKLELEYIINPKNLEQNNKKTELAYVISDKQKIDIDAETGKLISLYNYGDGNIEKPQYSDIDKSFAKKEIDALAELNIFLPGSEFKPKTKVTQRDFLYLLSKTRDSYIKYDDVDELYKILALQGIVRKGEKSPKAEITRQDAVKFIIRSLNFSKVAEIEGIYKVDFKDKKKVDKNLVGHIAIAKGLKIVGLTKKKEMKPKEKLTREQSVILIYNTLNIE